MDSYVKNRERLGMIKKSIGKNYFYNLLYEILTVLVPLVTTPYVSRAIGAEGIGTYSFTYSIATYFALFAALGTTVYARREVAYCQDNPEKRSVVFWEIFLFRIFASTISLLLYMAYVWRSSYKEIAIIQSFYIIAVVFDITWFFQGMENFGTVVLRNTVIKVINVAFIFLFVKSKNDLVTYIFGLAFLPLVGNIVTWSCIKKFVKLVPLKCLKPFRHVKGAIALFIPTIASQVYLLLDKTMIGIFSVGNIENGYYEQAQKIVKICWMFVTAFAAVMSPRVAYVFAKNDKKQLREYMKNSFSVIWFLSLPIAFGLLAISKTLVPWFFGDGYDKVAVLLSTFCWIVIPIGISSVTGSQYLVSTKRQTAYTVSILIGAVVNFCMNLILIPRAYSEGAAVASVTAEIIIAFVQVFYLTAIKKELDFGDVFLTAKNYLGASIIMYLLIKIITKYQSPSPFSTMIQILVGILTYIITLGFMKDGIVASAISKIEKVVEKNDPRRKKK